MKPPPPLYPDAEQRRINLTLGDDTRTVTIWRLSPAHAWFYRGFVLVRCRTGRKLHRRWSPQVIERDGQYAWADVTIHRRHATPVAWADDHPGSGWN